MHRQLQKFIESKASIYLAYALCAVSWGTGWYAIRLSVGEGGYPVMAAAAVRYTVASVVVALMIAAFPSALKGLSLKRAAGLVTIGLLNAAGIAFLYWGEKSVSGGLASVLGATSPVIAAVLALCTRTEKVTLKSLLGFCVALAGVAVIFGERLCVSPGHVSAMLAVLASAVLFASLNVVMKAKAFDINPLQSSLMFFLSMSVVFWLCLPFEGVAMPVPLPPVPTAAIIFLAVSSSGLALPAFFFLLRRSSLMFASSLSFVHPIIALVTDCIFERSFSLSVHAYAGMSIVMLGLLLCVLRNPVPTRLHTAESKGEAFAS